MSMVFCRGCAKQIHETAPVCPQCGAPQFDVPSSTASSGEGVGWGNPMAWVIACAPLIGAIAEGIIAGVSNYTGGWLVIITIGINIFLCDRDSKELAKNGINTSGLNTWLVPMYLFQRAKLLNEKVAYPILWCVLFFVQLVGAA
ncbi:MAG: hypothetical protein ABL906_00255 [Sideroxydans sp.]